MVFLSFKQIIALSIFILPVLHIIFSVHISCVATSAKQKSNAKTALSSKYMPYTQPYYNQAIFNQQYNYQQTGDYSNLDPNNFTIEVLPDDEDDSDGYLKFGLLRDAYGYGDSIHSY